MKPVNKPYRPSDFVRLGNQIDRYIHKKHLSSTQNIAYYEVKNNKFIQITKKAVKDSNKKIVNAYTYNRIFGTSDTAKNQSVWVKNITSVPSAKRPLPQDENGITKRKKFSRLNGFVNKNGKPIEGTYTLFNGSNSVYLNKNTGKVIKTGPLTAITKEFNTITKLHHNLGNSSSFIPKVYKLYTRNNNKAAFNMNMIMGNSLMIYVAKQSPYLRNIQTQINKHKKTLARVGYVHQNLNTRHLDNIIVEIKNGKPIVHIIDFGNV